jgi:regulator of sigma E protease
MGPVMNIVLAVVVLAFVLAQGAQVPAYQDEPPVVGSVMRGSPAERAGIMRGDRILTVAGNPVATWEELFMAIGTRRSDRDVSLTYLRDGETLPVTLRPIPDGRYEVSNIGVLPDINPGVASIIPGDLAEKAGLKAGDVILEVNDERMVTRSQLIEMISKNGGKELHFLVKRGDTEVPIVATPEQRGERGMLGFYLTEPTKTFHPGPFEAIGLSVKRNIESSGLIFRTLGGLFTGETSVRQLQGPVGIAQLSGESAQEGWIALLSLMAMLSINLGILNLMPVPVLDGGHIAILLLEGVARRDFSMQVKEKMLLAGFVVLMMLMVTVIYNDLTRISWIAGLMPWRN